MPAMMVWLRLIIWRQRYDGAIMDIMIPGKDGIEVLKDMREAGIQVPVLFSPQRHRHRILLMALMLVQAII